MTIEFDAYSALGVSQDATVDDIKAAYRRVARRLHPDVNRDNPGAAVQFQDITTAYELLIDDNRRRSYNAEIRAQEPKSHFTLRVTPSKRAITPLMEPQVIYLLAEILPDQSAQDRPDRTNTRLNLTLVLDHSNSMSGARLDRVKVAAHQIIDQMKPDDIFSVVGFNDFGEVIIAATPVTDKAALKARISMMTASGGTEIFKGLSLGIEQNKQYLAPRLVNHVILLTDGHTYGDHDRCIEIAKDSAKKGISISAMGLGQEWNDKFLDELASTTGGTSQYINSSGAVVRFLNDHVRNLANVFAERLMLSIAPDPDVRLEYAFKLLPSPQPLPIDTGYIPLGNLQYNRITSVLMQFELPANMREGFRSVARLVAKGDILLHGLQPYQALSDISLEITANPLPEDPPSNILDALGKLTLYRMQERAQEAIEQGDVQEATKRLQTLATRLLEMGEVELATEAQTEAEQLLRTNNLSDAGRKSLKYQTRHLIAGYGVGETTE